MKWQEHEGPSQIPEKIENKIKLQRLSISIIEFFYKKT
jgi:hypothetical protein